MSIIIITFIIKLSKVQGVNVLFYISFLSSASLFPFIFFLPSFGSFSSLCCIFFSASMATIIKLHSCRPDIFFTCCRSFVLLRSVSTAAATIAEAQQRQGQLIGSLLAILSGDVWGYFRWQMKAWSLSINNPLVIPFNFFEFNSNLLIFHIVFLMSFC